MKANKALALIGMLAIAGFSMGCSGDSGSDKDEDRSSDSDRSSKTDDDDDRVDNGYDPSGRAHGSGGVDGDNWWDYDDSDMKPLEVPDECDVSCAKERGEHKCFRDSSDICRECGKDLHCEKNIMAWGPKCDTANMMCVCDPANGDDDCRDRPLGKRCLKIGNYYSCTCEDDNDCPDSHPKCVGEVIKRCAEPCEPGKDCRYYYGGLGKCNDDGECKSIMDYGT